MQRAAAAALIASAATPAAEHLGGNKQTAFKKGVASIGVKYAGDQELVSYSDARTLAPVHEERHLRDVLKKKRPPAVARLTMVLDSSKAARSAVPSAGSAAPYATPYATPYAARCAERVREDQRGTAMFLQQLVARGPNVYARDMHGRDSLLVRQSPGRPMYLMAPDSPDPAAPPSFHRMDPDSAWRAWRSE